MKIKKKWLFLFLLLIPVMCIVGLALFKSFTISPLRKALPSTANEIHEWRWSEGGLTGQDYIYILSARITEQQFLEYVDRFDMTPHTPEREYSPGFALNWYPQELHTDETLEWWMPSRGEDGTYISDGGSWWDYAKWENAYIYVVSQNI